MKGVSVCGKAIITAWVMLLGCCFAQSLPAGSSALGSVVWVHVESRELRILSDDGKETTVTVAPNCAVLLVKPTETTLQDARTIDFANISAGDRILAALDPENQRAVRLVVMSAADIIEKNTRERADWAKNGVFGIVAAKHEKRLVLRSPGFKGEVRINLLVDESTVYRKYAPDSARFEDSLVSTFTDIQIGDQLRVRGQDRQGVVIASEVIFGTFLVVAGTITSIRPDDHEIDIINLANRKTLVVRISSASKLKAMPKFTGAIAARLNAGGKSSGINSPFAGMTSQNDKPPSLADVIDWLPAARVQELKVGDTVVVASTKPVDPRYVTAILLLDGADTLIQMTALQRAESDSPGGLSFVPKIDPSALTKAFDGLDVGAIKP